MARRKIDLHREVALKAFFNVVNSMKLNCVDFMLYPSKLPGFDLQCDLAMRAGKTREEKIELAQKIAVELSQVGWKHSLFNVHAENGYVYLEKKKG